MGPISDLMMKGLFFAAVLIGLSIFTFELTAANGKTMIDFSSNNFTMQILNYTNSTSQSFLSRSITSVPIIDSGIILVTGGFDVIKSTFGLVSNFVLSITSTYADILHIPNWLLPIILGGMAVYLLWTIISVVIGKEV